MGVTLQLSQNSVVLVYHVVNQIVTWRSLVITATTPGIQRNALLRNYYNYYKTWT